MNLFDEVSHEVVIYSRAFGAIDEYGDEVEKYDDGTHVLAIILPGDTGNINDAQNRPNGVEVHATLYMKHEFKTLRGAKISSAYGNFLVVGDPLPWEPIIDGWRWTVPLKRVDG